MDNFCGNCGSDNVECYVDEVDFGSGNIYVPLYKCNSCGFEWADDISGEVYHRNAESIKGLKMNKKLFTIALWILFPFYLIGMLSVLVQAEIMEGRKRMCKWARNSRR